MYIGHEFVGLHADAYMYLQHDQFVYERRLSMFHCYHNTVYPYLTAPARISQAEDYWPAARGGEAAYDPGEPAPTL